MSRNIKAENEAHPMNVAKQNTGAGTHVLNAQPQKTAPIIDADKWYLRCDPADMAENYCRAAEATLAREGIIDADACQIARGIVRNLKHQSRIIEVA